MYSLIIFYLLTISSQCFSILHREDPDPEAGPCVRRDYRHGSVVCVCNSKHCDTIPPVTTPPGGGVRVVTSSKDGLRWHNQVIHFNSMNSSSQDAVTVEIDRSVQYQKIDGFGGAFTDAAGINIMTLSETLKKALLRSYFSKDGLEYNLGRVPIGGTDFSIKPYTYNDLPDGEEDPDMIKFHLASEDRMYKIPLIQEALRMNPELKLFASPWSAPAWMKDNKKIAGKSKLLYKYYQSWAYYFVKFLKAYSRFGINFFAVTAQNEPTDGRIKSFNFNSMGWTALDQGDWVVNYLGPNLENQGFGDVKIYVVDDNRILVPRWIDKVMSIPGSSRYIGGIALHWYLDFVVSPYLLDLTNQRYPNLPILYTEACVGQWPWEPLKVVLGSWVRAEDYAHDIIQNLNHFVVGWTDWNLALNMKGGPNWIKNFVDAPIIVNAGNAEFLKQPTYYILGHFSKFLPRGSIKVHAGVSRKTTLEYVGFLRPDNSSVLIVLNKNSFPQKLQLKDRDKLATLEIKEHSIVSLIWE